MQLRLGEEDFDHFMGQGKVSQYSLWDGVRR